MKIILLSVLLLAGCATQSVPFQKSSNSVGYSIENKSTDNFVVKVQVPSDSDQKWVNKYAARAVGEECLTRGFDFFDYTEPNEGTAEGFCFKENKRKSLAITFSQAGLSATPAEFVVEDLNNKASTKLQLSDKLVAVDGKKVQSVAELKGLAFAQRNKNGVNVKIELVRAGKNLTVHEPLADMTGGCYDQAVLASLRRSVF